MHDGVYTNTTSTVTGTATTTGTTVTAAAATAKLNVYDPPTFSKAFNPTPITPNGTSVLTFTITNPATNPGTMSGLSFTDTLPTSPGAMTVAATPAITNPLPAACGAGAAVTAAANASTIKFSGGILAPGASCSFSVTVTASSSGSYNNTVSLDNTGGGLISVNTGGGKLAINTAVTATATLVVNQSLPILTITKTVSTQSDPVNGINSPKAIPGATAMYAITVANSGPGSVTADSTVITDPIPANLTLCTGNSSGSSGLTVAFTDSGSGLTPLTAADISYSSAAGGGAPYTYTPAANTCDPAITGLRINPKGILSGASGTTTPSFLLTFKTLLR